MAIFWFGKANKLDDFKVKDLEKEKLVQQVQYDQLLSRQRRAGAETEGLLETASEPGITDSEKDLAAYRMSRSEKRRLKAESDMDIGSRMTGANTPVSIFTVAYGWDADMNVMRQIAEWGHGQAYKANRRTIKRLYELLSVYF